MILVYQNVVKGLIYTFRYLFIKKKKKKHIEWAKKKFTRKRAQLVSVSPIDPRVNCIFNETDIRWTLSIFGTKILCMNLGFTKIKK